MVTVELGNIVMGGVSNNAGIFTGQNIQNSWDSHSPSATSFGFLMGDYNRAYCGYTMLYNNSVQGQPTIDNDYKGNCNLQQML